MRATIGGLLMSFWKIIWYQMILLMKKWNIKKVLKEHKVKDGPIDKETAVDIAIAVSKNLNYDDFFTKPTEYRISPRLDANAYLVSISPVLENPNLLVELNTDNVAISQTDGTVIAYWVS